MDAIVLDGNQRASLAITRSLGKMGIKISVGEESKISLASRSRYSSSSFSYPSPYRDPRGFIDELANYASNRGMPVLFPVTDVALSEVMRNIDRLRGILRIPFVDHDRYELISDKCNLFAMAGRLGIPMPKTVFSEPLKDETPASARREVGALGMPVVVKPARSRIFTNRGWVRTSVLYAENLETLDRILGTDPFRTFPFVLQEKIEGPGVGIFLLMFHGNVIARFAHRRIREKPPSGGVSVLCESIEPPADAIEAATRLLREVDWTGVAMVEFKQDKRDGVHKLIEVNARFWGSLQLAISSGVDFPYLLYRIARGDIARGPDRYRIGLRSRWELGDLDHLIIRLRKTAAELFLPADAPSRGVLMVRFFWDFLKPSVRGEVLRPDDPGPFLFELKEYVRHVAGRS